MSVPQHTRLRYLKSKNPDKLTAHLAKMPRVQIYGAPVFQNNKWWVWYVIGDAEGRNFANLDLDTGRNG